MKNTFFRVSATFSSLFASTSFISAIKMKLLNSLTLGLAAVVSLASGAAVEKRDLASTLLSDIESATTCAACDVCISLHYIYSFRVIT